VVDPDPLRGFTVAITADRHRDELATLLEQRGARVVLAPALRIVPLADDAELRTVTGVLIDNRPDIIVACTGIGLRGWVEAAESWGLAEPLRSVIRSAQLVSEEPRARDTTDKPTPAAPATAGAHWDALLTRLLTQGVAGRRIAVQLHGEPEPELVNALRAAGADVVEVSVHRWVPPSDPTPLRRLVDLATSRLVDAITFTSAPAVGALLRVAGSDVDALLEALRTDVLAACLGPVTAGPLLRRGVPASVPTRVRAASLVKLLVEELPKRAPTLRVAGQEVTLRGHAALVDGSLKPLAPAPMAVLRALAVTPGRVLSRSALLAALPRSADEHAVEMAVARLRAALGGSSFVQTIAKRGYRLRVD
jgi:uroporphyrinogen-III synthase